MICLPPATPRSACSGFSLATLVRYPKLSSLITVFIRPLNALTERPLCTRACDANLEEWGPPTKVDRPMALCGAGPASARVQRELIPLSQQTGWPYLSPPACPKSNDRIHRRRQQTQIESTHSQNPFVPSRRCRAKPGPCGDRNRLKPTTPRRGETAAKAPR